MLSTATASLLEIPMTHDEQQFLNELRTRIGLLREEAGLSQQAVADALEIAQQTYANYEVARDPLSRCFPRAHRSWPHRR